MGWHVPDMSPAPHLADGAYEQNCFSGQRKPAMPPHILPSGEALGDGAGVADDEGAGGGSGPELTTPVGVSTGTGGALLTLVAGAGGVLGALVGASGVGAGCAEQLANAANDRNATHACTRFDFRMRQH